MLRTTIGLMLGLLCLAFPALAEEDSPLLQNLGEAPDFALETLDGSSLRLSQALKQGPVLLDFWATWCGPCRQSMPVYQELYERYRERGLQVWAVSEDSPRAYEKIEPFFASRKLDFPALLDRKKEVGAAYGIQVLPTSFLISREGRIVARHMGFLPGTERVLDEQIQAVLQAPVPGTEMR